jgi:hypothetical protein
MKPVGARQPHAMLGAALVLFLSGCGGASSAPNATESSGSTPTQATANTPSSAPNACGTDGQPDCPLQRWMKSTLQTYLRNQQYERLGPAFEELAALDMSAYPKWQAFAAAGQRAAGERDGMAVKQSCKGCHDAYRSRYRRERRDHAVF